MAASWGDGLSTTTPYLKGEAGGETVEWAYTTKLREGNYFSPVPDERTAKIFSEFESEEHKMARRTVTYGDWEVIEDANS